MYQTGYYATGYYATGYYMREAGRRSVHPPGMGYSKAELRRRILDEDEVLMAVVMAFLHIKDD